MICKQQGESMKNIIENKNETEVTATKQQSDISDINRIMFSNEFFCHETMNTSYFSGHITFKKAII